jgi:hypothetical protein
MAGQRRRCGDGDEVAGGVGTGLWWCGVGVVRAAAGQHGLCQFELGTGLNGSRKGAAALKKPATDEA